MAEPVNSPIGRGTASHIRPPGIRQQLFVEPKACYLLFTPRNREHVITRVFKDFIRDGHRPYRCLLLDEHIVDEPISRLKRRVGMSTY